MSFLNLRALRNQKVTTVADLSDEALVKVFQRCDDVTILRCSNVCRRWRALIFMEERKPHSLVRRAQNTVGIFIVDRRRAILERMCPGSEPTKLTATRSECSLLITPSIRTPRTTRSSHNDMPPKEQVLPLETTTVFMEDQFVDQTQASWAFTFDFSSWANKHHVVEVCLQNFCSFLDREHPRMEFPGGNGHSDGNNHGSSPQSGAMLTPPWSGGVAGRSPPGEGSTGNGVLDQRGYAYYQLPSARALMIHNPPLTVMDDETIAELTRLSSGRLERLAKTLSVIRPLHIVFRDHSLYNHRPTLLLIWFLKLLQPSVRRVTFDGIQAHHLIPLHKIFDLSGIDELNVNQPRFSPAICVSHRLLINWLALPAQHRRRLRMRLSGCRTMTARGLAVFVQSWKVTPEPCLFDQISIDLRSVPVYDFLAEMETPTKDPEEPEDWRPPTPPAAAYGHGPMAATSRWTNCKLTVKHRKSNVTLNMCVAEGFIVLRCNAPREQRLTPQGSTLCRRNLPRPSSSQCFETKAKSGSLPRYEQSSLKRIDTEPLHRSPSVFDKMFGFLLRSNA
uniref:F-box domain-containing protein n=1 Tax=Haemonchus contortus TaxID=6289 RepID=A0A7I5ECL9_HAECO|nr:Cyclin F-box domain containing protein [Haemonchus contortus]